MATNVTFPVEQGLRPLMKDLGIRADHVLRRAGLPDDLFSRPGSGLSTTEHFRLWQSLDAEAADPLLPLHLAEAIQAESFVPPLFAALCSVNMLQAAQRLATYKRLIAPMRLAAVTGSQGELSLSPQWIAAEGEAPFILVASELAFLMRVVRMATREPVRAVKVTMPTLPAKAQTKAYADYFGIPVRRDGAPSLTLSAVDANRPFLTANDAMWQVFEPDLRRRLGELDAAATTAQRVRSALLELLPGGQPGIETVASRLAMSSRTLQRRLEAEGDSFRSVVNRTREDLARHYLTQTKLSASEIGFLLGFEDPNSFFRAFNDWTGKTPEALRESGPSSTP
ncbi:AraC family transcriptional regulator [Dyella mobilis]|uniref:AraC family transcriptional regulator ligand-binding domain-containing protein n=1 Tax=Dyella mobilis TaxID=1849582 RepID=A0ABS2KF50_9GAMM|nr:AraC family transcriptional regulator [Dyella mobilis]MBM7129553.1 AraC family transcriptional regulator ligand-binding domain-containing protein [Dyella mobilis]GLQ98184.1 AraC family transcriptional regulator [Dyella mobilis]